MENVPLIEIARLIALSPLAVIVYFFYASGVLSALAGRLKAGAGDHEERIAKIEENDIRHLENDVSDIKNNLKDIFRQLGVHGNRLTRLETKINGK